MRRSEPTPALDGSARATWPDRPPFAEEATDARLVESARSGDDDSFAQLVERYQKRVVRILTRLVHDPELARDLAQETFWKVYTRLDRFDTARRFGPWLFRVAVNLGLDWLRGHKHHAPSLVSIDATPHGQANAFEPTHPDPRIRADLAQEVRFLLDQLPVAYRTILILRDVEGFSSAEVATIVDRREATIRWRLAKAREMFRELWERRQNSPRATLPLPAQDLDLEGPRP